MSAGLFVCAMLLSCTARGPDSVLLITVDTVRADHLSAYGYGVPTSPVLERLAENGVRFEFAFSASACTAPSTASILTGRYPSFHTVGLLNGHYQLHHSTPTLAGVLRNQGFRTGAIVGNPVLRSEIGLDVGFESYDDDLERHELNRRNMRERNADRIVDLAVEWLDASDKRPFFLWLHFQDPHGPYTPPERWRSFGDGTGRQKDQQLSVGSDNSGYQAIPMYQVFHDERRLTEYLRRYDSEIAFFDYQVGRLLAFLAKLDLERSTLIVLTADHGEAFGEDGFYFGHSHSVGLDQVRVPLVVVGPDIPPGTVVRTPVSNTTVMATVLHALGLQVPEDVVGPSLFEVLECGGEQAQPLYFETPNQSGIVFGNTYFRHDRRPSSDSDFWTAGNINTGGFWKPLGLQLIEQLDPDRSPAPPSFAKTTEVLLEKFDSSAFDSRADLEHLRVLTNRSSKTAERLRALGYSQ